MDSPWSIVKAAKVGLWYRGGSFLQLSWSASEDRVAKWYCREKSNLLPVDSRFVTKWSLKELSFSIACGYWVIEEFLAAWSVMERNTPCVESFITAFSYLKSSCSSVPFPCSHL
ncbi:hypothetical protein ACMFMF_005457 [Clarireedia jacksonii]